MPARKKDPTTRARANRAATAAKLSDGRTVIRPELPPRGFDEDGNELPWNAQTVSWWDDLWAAPMAAEYHSSDRHALFMLAVMVDLFWTQPSKDLAAEIRMQRQAFGLTPYDRRRLEWTIETAEDAKDHGKTRRAARAPAGKGAAAAGDPRLALVQ